MIKKAILAAVFVGVLAWALVATLSGGAHRTVVRTVGTTSTTQLRPYNPYGKAYALTTICDPQCTTTISVGN